MQSNYNLKYNKYKKKYLNLQNKQIGGMIGSEPREVTSAKAGGDTTKEDVSVQPLTDDIYIELNFYKFLYIFNYMLNTTSKKQLYSIYQLDTNPITLLLELNIIYNEPNYIKIKEIKDNFIKPIFMNTTKDSEIKGRHGFSDIDNIIMAVITYCFDLKLNSDHTTKETSFDETFEVVNINVDKINKDHKILFMLHAMILNYDILLKNNSTVKLEDQENIPEKINENINNIYTRWKDDPTKRKYFKYHY